MQYLYGTHRIGVCLSPLSETDTVPYEKHPLPIFLQRGLQVSLSTEEPLQTHHAADPLTQEYATAQKLFRLSALDVTELARNSVMMSSFPHKAKCDWLGEEYNMGPDRHQPDKPQVSGPRVEYRDDVWVGERELFNEMRMKPQQQEATTAQQTHNASLSRWSFLSSVKDVEYFAVLDNRIRFPRTVICGPQDRDEATKLAAPRVARGGAAAKEVHLDAPHPNDRQEEHPSGGGIFEGRRRGVDVCRKRQRVHPLPQECSALMATAPSHAGGLSSRPHGAQEHSGQP